MNMAKQVVDAMVEGGKATAAPPLGPALGPLGINIGQVIAKINEKTADFKGMQVPVKITVESTTKEFSITVGTPPASALIKKEANVEKGAGNPLAEKVADIRIEQAIKVAKMKMDSLTGKNFTNKVKEVIGTCDSMGILVEGKQARETIADINKGMFADKIKSMKTELSKDELAALEHEKIKLKEQMATRRAELEVLAKSVIKSMENKPRNSIKNKLLEMKIPLDIVEALLPAEEASAATAASPAAAAPAKKK